MTESEIKQAIKKATIVTLCGIHCGDSRGSIRISKAQAQSLIKSAKAQKYNAESVDIGNGRNALLIKAF